MLNILVKQQWLDKELEVHVYMYTTILIHVATPFVFLCIYIQACANLSAKIIYVYYIRTYLRRSMNEINTRA